MNQTIRTQRVRLPLRAITEDDELQPRARMDRPTWEEYAHLLTEGVRLPPVLVVADPENVLWLADGYHRLFAYRSLDVPEVDADVRPGTRLDALRLSLAANAEHGKQRTKGDYQRAYGIARRNGLVDPAEPESVAAVLRCSIRWARDLTHAAREEARAARDAAIIAAMDAGETQAGTAARLGVDQSTVSRGQEAERARRQAAAQSERERNAKRHDAETHSAADSQRPDPDAGDEPEQDPPHEPASVAAAAQTAERAQSQALKPVREPVRGRDGTQTPEARAWHGALQALREITAQPSPDVLFADRFTGFDHVFGPELQAAHAWVNEMHRRFFA